MLPSNTEPKFTRLRDQWRRETAHLSSVGERCVHPAYQHIIGMGEAAVPLILRELEAHLDDWFWALHAITCEDPISDEIRGSMAAMANAWIDWGRRHGQL